MSKSQWLENERAKHRVVHLHENEEFNHPDGLDIKASTATSSDEAAQDLHYGIAGRTWEAARLLHAFLSGDATYLAHSKTIVELGSGTGFLGLKIAPQLDASATLILTDLRSVCPLLERNISAASASSCRVVARPLPWGDRTALQRIREEFGPIDLVLCADLVYFKELFAALLRSLIDITDQEPSPAVLFAYQSRTLAKETPFLNAFGAYFDLEPVTIKRDGVWQRLGADRDAFVFIARRRKGVAIPTSDAELLSNAVDDAFELSLLSNLDVVD